ncbi:MAG: lysine--tRNA ligase [Anaerolineaceae bacterium]|nr:lysine--tRNA ligase [Anaerolineaceae bacterium]MBN2676994.1 lysine--tRNA ligase [Anaerolineaceae bacterium]
MAENLSDLEKIRLGKLKRLKEQGVEPYPIHAEQSTTSQQAIATFEAAEKEGTADKLGEVTLAGRIRGLRPMGKLIFAHIEDRNGRIQLFFRVNELGEARMKSLMEDYDLGDFIQASGELMRTRTGEITLLVKDFKMLAKAITPLPAAKDEVVDGELIRHASLTDPETRYRQRYADLAVNADVRTIFRTRAHIIRSLRDFLDSRDFLEVETPVLQPVYGGAAARPFTTHHNQLKQDLYLRISFELYLKRLLVGGLERVYEIGRDFRNEGVSFKHNPEFTMLEFYMAYADADKIMALTEEMVSSVAKQVKGSTVIEFGEHTIDLAPPWKRATLRDALQEATGIDINEHPDAESLASIMQEKGMEAKPGTPRGKLIDGLLSDHLEPILIQPTFLYDYPRDISPLAKSKPDDPQTVERFEGFTAGFELCNAFSELNDPLDQEQRFIEMGRSYENDDELRHPMDEDYLKALRYGMPPAGGFGMGIDRLVMLLTGIRSLREVILFPHLRKTDEDKL